MLSIRHKTIVKSILGHPGGITGKQLSELLRVSDKTIRNDIAEVNQWLREQGLCICASHKQGYFIEEKQKSQIIGLLKEQDFPKSREVQTPWERRFAILDRALGRPGIRIEKLAENLYVSEQTLYKDIVHLQQKLKIVCEFSGLRVQNHRLYIQGPEEEIRRLVFRLICAIVLHSGQLMDNSLHQLMSSIVNLNEIYTFYEHVETYCVQMGVILPDQVLYIVAWMLFYVNVRREERHFLENQIFSASSFYGQKNEGKKFPEQYVNLSKPFFKYCERDRLSQFLVYMNKSFFLEFEDSDLEFLYKALRAVGFLSERNYEKQAEELFEEFSQKLNREYHLVFFDCQEQKKQFLCELDCLLWRVKERYQFCDWWLWNQENRNFISYETGILMAKMIQQKLGNFLTRTEVYRIARLVQACTSKGKKMIRAQMVYGEDMGWYYIVRRWIEERLGDQVEICGVCPRYLVKEQCRKNQLNLLIEALIREEEQEFLSFTLSKVLDVEEEKRFWRFVEENILKKQVFSCLKDMLSRHNTILFDKEASFEDMAFSCVQALEKYGCIRQSELFFKEMMERQEYYPPRNENYCWFLQAFGRQAVFDGIAIAVEQGKENLGKVVFVGAFSPRLETKVDFEYMGKFLQKFLSSGDLIDRIRKAEDGQQIIEEIFFAACADS